MYEEYTKQSLPTKEYRELVGTALCVFNSNNAFIIENILRSDTSKKYTWYDLIDMTSGNLIKPIKNTITKNFNTKITNLFTELIKERNRIIHSYRITDDKGEQILCTKDKEGNQFYISKKYLMDFIIKNDKLSQMLCDYRGY